MKSWCMGNITLLDKDNPAVFAYTREWKGKKVAGIAEL
jgi:hypothetical protein